MLSNTLQLQNLIAMKKLMIGLFLLIIAMMADIRGYSQQNDFGIRKPGNIKMLPTGEFALNPELTYNSSPFEQDQSAMAFNGTVYLIVWTDTRSGLGKDIYGARLGTDGSILDPSGFIICDYDGLQENPSVTSNGEIFLVVWEDDRHQETSGIDIYGARVSADGTLLDQNGIALSTASDDQTLPAASSAEGNFFTLWVDRRSGTNNDIYGTFVTNSGSVANPEGLAICNQGGWQNSPDICYDGSRYFIVWSDQRGFSKDIYGVFLKPDGTLSQVNGTGIVTLFNNQESPSIAWSGNQFFLAWEEIQAGATMKIHGGRLSASGVIIDINGIEIASYEGFDFCTDPHVTSMDADFLVAFTKGMGDFTTTYNVIAKRISSEGIVLDPDGLVITPENLLVEPLPAVDFSGSNALVSWTDDRSFHADIYASRITPSGNLLDPEGLLVSKGYNEQFQVDLAFDGTNYLAVWCDTRNNNIFDLYAARINDQGAVMDPGAIEIASGNQGKMNPSVAFNGTEYLVAWDNGNDIFATRVSTAGAVTVPGGIIIYEDEFIQQKPVVASDGENWLVAWEDYRNSTGRATHGDIYGAIITNDGSPASFPIAALPEDQINPDIVFGNDRYVVIWEDHRVGAISKPNIYGARVLPAGSVLDVNGIGIVVDETTAMMEPAVAFDGNNFMACWQSGTSGNFDVYGIRFDQALAKLDPEPAVLSAALRDQYSVSLAYTGEHYMALWMDQTALMHYRISMAKILPDGTIAETGVLSELENNMMHPAIVHGPLKQVLTAFSAFILMADDEPVNAVRAMGLMIGQGQGPGIVENNSGIISSFEVYPNPASDKITVVYELADKAPVVISLLALDGKNVKILANVRMAKGSSSRTCDLKALPDGIYILKLSAGDSAVTKKILLTGN